MASSHRPVRYGYNPPTLLGGSNKLATFEPGQLTIVCGDDARYWKIPPEESKGVPAELLQVCWLEVRGSIRGAVKGSKYRISFTISLKSDAFGWNKCPVYVMAKFGTKGTYSWKRIMLHPSELGKLEIGDLEIQYKDDATSGNDTIYFGLYELWSGKWKGGLLLHCATVQQLA